MHIHVLFELSMTGSQLLQENLYFLRAFYPKTNFELLPNPIDVTDGEKSKLHFQRFTPISISRVIVCKSSSSVASEMFSGGVGMTIYLQSAVES
mmetsp:Transcript_1029/g.1219  ORF Transcript_1029/g.1219 Transcript_1029/m.1219 type:complete len:94 (+) Transcript_1029:20-301(+)